MKTNGIYHNGNGHNGSNGSYANGNGHNGNGHVIAPPVLLAPERVEPRRYYDTNFVVTDEYRASLPKTPSEKIAKHLLVAERTDLREGAFDRLPTAR